MPKHIPVVYKEPITMCFANKTFNVSIGVSDCKGKNNRKFFSLLKKELGCSKLVEKVHNSFLMEAIKSNYQPFTFPLRGFNGGSVSHKYVAKATKLLRYWGILEYVDNKEGSRRAIVYRYISHSPKRTPNTGTSVDNSSPKIPMSGEELRLAKVAFNIFYKKGFPNEVYTGYTSRDIVWLERMVNKAKEVMLIFGLIGEKNMSNMIKSLYMLVNYNRLQKGDIKKYNPRYITKSALNECDRASYDKEQMAIFPDGSEEGIYVCDSVEYF